MNVSRLTFLLLYSVSYSLSKCLYESNTPTWTLHWDLWTRKVIQKLRIYQWNNRILAYVKGRYTYDVHENCLIFKSPQHLRPKYFHPLDLGRSALNEAPRRPSTFSNKIMEQQPHCACGRTKSKQKHNQVTSQSNWPRVLLLDFSSRTKQWYC